MDLREKLGNMKAKGYYLLYSGINVDSPDGIEKKILSQKKLFEGIGIEMKFVELHRKSGSFWNDVQELTDADFVYFRKSTIIDWRFVKFFRRLKKNGNPIIFMEIPTYPYEGELGSGWRVKLRMFVDNFYRKRLCGLIDRIVVTGFDVGATLWGIPAINIVNGIDLASVKIRQRCNHEGVVLGCIAKFSPWHGYERLIKGLAEYYKTVSEKNVKILMVGEGPEKDAYVNLVNELGIGEYVVFTGRLTGSALDKIYEIIDLGICSLGRYKSGIEVIGDLKSREFMAKGIPMICGCQIDVLQGGDYPFAYFVPNDDSKINIKELLDFYYRIYDGTKNTEIMIRDVAERLIDFTVTYSKVVETAKELIWAK